MRIIRNLASFTLVGFIAVAIARPASADPASFDWGSISSAGDNTFGVYDTDNTTILNTGDYVQLIWTGPNGVIDPPDLDGLPGGDDVLLDESFVVNGSPLPPPLQNKGYVPLVTYTFDTTDPQIGGLIYIRAWNEAAPGGATAYGDSITGTISNGAVFNAPRWNTNVEFTASTPTPSPTASHSPTVDVSPTFTNTPTHTITPTSGPTATSTFTQTPTSTVPATSTPTPTGTPPEWSEMIFLPIALNHNLLEAYCPDRSR